MIIGFPAVREYFSGFSYTSILRINTRSSSGVSLGISIYSFALFMNSCIHFFRISISLMRSVMDCSSCRSSACSCSYPPAMTSYRSGVIRPQTLSSYRHRIMLSNSLIRFSICIFSRSAVLRLCFTVLSCHHIKFFRLFSCKGGYCFEVVQYNLVKHIFPDIVCGTVAGSPLETSALKIIVFRLYGFSSVQISFFLQNAFVPTQKSCGL